MLQAARGRTPPTLRARRTQWSLERTVRRACSRDNGGPRACGVDVHGEVQRVRLHVPVQRVLAGQHRHAVGVRACQLRGVWRRARGTRAAECPNAQHPQRRAQEGKRAALRQPTAAYERGAAWLGVPRPRALRRRGRACHTKHDISFSCTVCNIPNKPTRSPRLTGTREGPFLGVDKPSQRVWRGHAYKRPCAHTPRWALRWAVCGAPRSASGWHVTAGR